MRANMSWSPLVLMLVAMLVGCVKCSPADCDCNHHYGGCVIGIAAPAGFKCRCSYDGGWTCSGTAFPCVGKEQCPGNLADYCACKLGKGDCDGYRNPVTACEGSGKPRIGVTGSADCDCGYSSGGCTVIDAAPFGWKCVCVYKGFWTCTGWAEQCAAKEICLGDDFSYCACKQGNGDCGGYPDKTSSCPSPHVSTSCNCDRAADWSRSFYTIDKVTYDSDNVQIHSFTPLALAEKDIPNHSGETQSISFRVRETMTHTSSFSQTSGIMIQVGTTFKVGVPEIAEVSASFSVTSSLEHTYGNTESYAILFDSQFTCNGAPYKHTTCSVTMQKARVTVPYTMMVKHKIIPNCACESYGVWTGIQAYNARLVSKEMEN